MTPSEIALLLAAFGAFFATMGGGIKWLLAHIDAKTSEAQLQEVTARALLGDRLNEDIRMLRSDIAALRAEKAIFLRRIYQLEGFIHMQPGITIPTMEGWPPND
jgi:hypothetical protein